MCVGVWLCDQQQSAQHSQQSAQHSHPSSQTKQQHSAARLGVEVSLFMLVVYEQSVAAGQVRSYAPRCETVFTCCSWHHMVCMD